jgi:hypothetical protein
MQIIGIKPINYIFYRKYLLNMRHNYLLKLLHVIFIKGIALRNIFISLIYGIYLVSL